MGGEHGNVPLEKDAGEIVARFIVESGQHVVLDLSLMRKAHMHAFMADFLDTDPAEWPEWARVQEIPKADVTMSICKSQTIASTK